MLVPRLGSIASGDDHTCALRTGQVACWGENIFGQVGDGTSQSPRATPLVVGSIADAVDVTAGSNFSCATLSTGTVQCWGQNGLAQLGRGNTSGSEKNAGAVSGLTDAVQVAAGSDFACALRSTGEASCWGWNDWGQLGDSSTSQRRSPVAVTGIADVVQVDAGNDHTCALHATGAVSCWGRNHAGQLGKGTTSTRETTPVLVSGISNATRVAAGNDFSCAVLDDGQAACWGYNIWGQLGNGTTSNQNPTPTNVSMITDAVAIEVGGKHACAVRASGAVSCWGYNDFGQLGNGTTTRSSVPVDVAPLMDAAGIATGSGLGHSCAERANGAIDCWGYNIFGQLGTGSTTLREASPVAVISLP